MEEQDRNPQGESPHVEPAQPESEVPADLAAQQSETASDGTAAEPSVTVDELLAGVIPEGPVETAIPQEDADLKAILEAIVYVAEEPLTLAQIAASLQEPAERVKRLLDQLIVEFDQPGHGVSIREVAGGYKMATKAEHHDAVRNFVKSLKPPLKLSLPALETLAVIAYKQPVTGPEIMEIRGVQGGGVLKTLLDRKLIAAAGRKNVIGKPMLYKTTKEFLIQFGLKDIAELPSLKEFEEIRRMAFSEGEPAPDAAPETGEASGEALPAGDAGAPAADAEPAAATVEDAPDAQPAAVIAEGAPDAQPADAPPPEPESPEAATPTSEPQPASDTEQSSTIPTADPAEES
jgi:segregation and condensation protein B